MAQFNLVITIIGCLVLAIGLVGRSLRERLFVAEPLAAFILGILLGPRVLGVIGPVAWPQMNAVAGEIARLTLATGLMGVALRIPHDFLPVHWRSLALVLGLLMPLMWAAGGLLIWLFAGLPFWAAMLAGAAVTPTDPIVASSIITGDLAETRVPGRLRHLLSLESGFNDGLAYAFVYFALLFLTKPPAQAVVEWLWKTVLWEIAGATAFGLIIGTAAGKFLLWAERKRTVAQESILAHSLALSFIALGAGKLLGTDGVLAVFVAGVVFARIVHSVKRSHHEHLQESINIFFNLPSFFLLGVIVPWEAWGRLGAPAGIALGITVLALRRPPFLFCIAPLVKPLRTVQDKIFFGWFGGPVGISALFYGTLIFNVYGYDAVSERVWAVITLVIAWSLVLHGISATWGTKALFPAKPGGREWNP